MRPRRRLRFGGCLVAVTRLSTRVLHGLLNRGVAEQFLHFRERSAVHHQARRKSAELEKGSHKRYEFGTNLAQDWNVAGLQLIYDL